MNCIAQESGDGWTLFSGDCVEVLQGLPSHSIDYSIFSPPFASLYTYSNSPRDMGNCKTNEEFFEHFGFLVAELLRRHREDLIRADHDRAFRVVVLWLLTALSAASNSSAAWRLSISAWRL